MCGSSYVYKYLLSMAGANPVYGRVSWLQVNFLAHAK